LLGEKLWERPPKRILEGMNFRMALISKGSGYDSFGLGRGIDDQVFLVPVIHILQNKVERKKINFS